MTSQTDCSELFISSAWAKLVNIIGIRLARQIEARWDNERRTIQFQLHRAYIRTRTRAHTHTY